MKKLLIGLLAVLTMLALVACQKKEEVKPSGDVEPVVVEENTPAVVSGEAEEEQVGVGNTDEGMVALVLEDYIKNMYSGDVEEVTFKNIKVYSPAEISGEECGSGGGDGYPHRPDGGIHCHGSPGHVQPLDHGSADEPGRLRGLRRRPAGCQGLGGRPDRERPLLRPQREGPRPGGLPHPRLHR